ncbi:MAG: regulatory iron-sulfur-containing complex subunit RicT [Planctomycetota bacterium]
MSILPLPQFEQDLAAYEEDRALYERLELPKTLVVRYGAMRMVGEFKYDGDVKPGCGSKIVVKTPRGTEIGEMLTSTCPNAGCSKSVSRAEMLEYIENSGGADYPFDTNGRALRVATVEDMQKQKAIEDDETRVRTRAQQLVDEHRLPMRLKQAEQMLGGEQITFFFIAEDRVDFRELARALGHEFGTRVEMRHVGARDEARLVADYEKCGQHCCCKQFLKVLKPVSIRSAKQQKATLDPLKISGRCGRLMCCLRYEDETYNTLIKKLPKIRKRVGTPEGPGKVVDRQVLTQLVLVQIEGEERKRLAFPVEELIDVEEAERILEQREKEAKEKMRAASRKRSKDGDPLRGMSAEEVEQRTRGRGKRRRSKDDQQQSYKERSQREDAPPQEGEEGEAKPKRRRGKRGGRKRTDSSNDQNNSARSGDAANAGDAPMGDAGDGASSSPGSGAPKKKRSRGKRGGRGRGGKGKSSGGGWGGRSSG